MYTACPLKLCGRTLKSTGRPISFRGLLIIVSTMVLWESSVRKKENQSVEKAGVAIVKGADERNTFFKKK